MSLRNNLRFNIHQCHAKRCTDAPLHSSMYLSSDAELSLCLLSISNKCVLSFSILFLLFTCQHWSRPILVAMTGHRCSNWQKIIQIKSLLSLTHSPCAFHIIEVKQQQTEQKKKKLTTIDIRHTLRPYHRISMPRQTKVRYNDLNFTTSLPWPDPNHTNIQKSFNEHLNWIQVTVRHIIFSLRAWLQLTIHFCFGCYSSEPIEDCAPKTSNFNWNDASYIEMFCLIDARTFCGIAPFKSRTN